MSMEWQDVAGVNCLRDESGSIDVARDGQEDTEGVYGAPAECGECMRWIEQFER